MAKNKDKETPVEEPGTEVINWEEKLAQEAGEVAKLERPPVSNINFRGGVMTYMGQAVPDNEMNVVIICYALERTYYPGAWDADKIVPPDCYALGTPQQADDMVPADNVPDPVHQNCEACPNNQWRDDGKGKDCKERRRLIMIPADALESVEKLVKAEQAKASIPTTSMKNWAKYVNAVAAQTQRPYWAVQTRVFLTPHQKHQFHVNFDFVGKVDNEMLGELQKMNESGMALALTPIDMKPSTQQDEGAKPADAKY